MSKQKIKVVSRGLGDDLAKLTYITGISRMAKGIAKALGKEDCGCEERQEQLNKLVPYNKKEK